MRPALAVLALAVWTAGASAAPECWSLAECKQAHAGYCRIHHGCWHGAKRHTKSAAPPRSRWPEPPFNPNPYGDPSWTDVEVDRYGDPIWRQQERIRGSFEALK